MATTQQIDRVGRFTDQSSGGGIYAGYRDAASLESTSKGQLRRSLKPYSKYLPGLNKLKRYSTSELEAIATRAVMKKRGYEPKKLPTRINRQKYGTPAIQRAKRVMAMEDPTRRALNQTREVRRHIRMIRRNREIMKLPLWPGVPREVLRG